MGAVAVKQSSNDTTRKHKVKEQIPGTAEAPIFSSPDIAIQRKPSCPCGGGCPRCRGAIQPKLKINQPGDIYEQEADRVAEQVMATSGHPVASSAPSRVQRVSEYSNGEVNAVPSSVEQVLATPGRPLEPSLRQDMEQRFSYDFSRVRVHTGAASAASATQLNARAYSCGADIVYGEGRGPGVNLLTAHELAHVAQNQAGAEANVVRRSEGFEEEPTFVEEEPTPTGEWHGQPRGHVERAGGGRELTEEVAGETVEEELTLEEALAELEAEELGAGALAGTLGEILLILGPVVVLFVGLFGSIVEAQAKLREEAYRLGFSEGMAANLLGMGARWVKERLIERPRGNYPEVSVGGFKAAQVGGNNQGVVDGYRLVQSFTDKQRVAFLKHGFEKVVATRGPFAMNPENFGRDDVITLGIALQPTVVKLIESARQQELARQKARREKLLGPRGRGWAAS